MAAHYDVLMSHVPYDMWVSYYQLLLAHVGSKPKRLLDVCCGTGVIAELLAEQGYEVVGFDISPEMISQAKKKALEKGLALSYHVADAAHFELGETFDGAFSFFDSLNYIIEPDDLASAIERVARHLTPGSTFVFDVNTAYAFEQQMFDQAETSRKAPIRYDWVGNYDPKSRIIRVSMSFERDGVEFHELHVQRAYTVDELLEYLDQAGFGEVTVFDSYTLQPPRKRSDRLHFVAVLD